MVVNLEMEDFFADEEDEVLVGVEELDNEEEELDGLDDLEDLDESLEVVEDDSSELVEDFGVSSEEELEPTDEEPEQPKEVVNTVERYSSTELAYPCFVLDGSEVFPKHIISGLTKMIESSLTIEDTIKVYVSIDGNLSSIGGVSSLQVKAIIDLLGREKITAYYEKGYVLNGDLIYTLSS
jgi:hypothetical protein